MRRVPLRKTSHCALFIGAKSTYGLWVEVESGDRAMQSLQAISSARLPTCTLRCGWFALIYASFPQCCRHDLAESSGKNQAT